MTYETKQARDFRKTGAGPAATVQALLASCEAEDFSFHRAAPLLACSSSTGPSKIPTLSMPDAQQACGRSSQSRAQPTEAAASCWMRTSTSTSPPKALNPRACQLPKAPHSWRGCWSACAERISEVKKVSMNILEVLVQGGLIFEQTRWNKSDFNSIRQDTLSMYGLKG